MSAFTYKAIKLNKNNPAKWYVSYTIKWSDKPTEYVRLYGGEYAIRLNEFSTNKERDKNADWLLNEVTKDLALGINPKDKLTVVAEQIEASKKKAMGLAYNDAVAIMIEHYNYDNPVPSSELTALGTKSFFGGTFKKYVQSLEKMHDVKSITKAEVENLLIQKNTAKKWNIKTCISKLSIVTQLFIPLLERGIIDINPASGITNIKQKLKRLPQKNTSKRYEIWTDAEMEELEAFSNNPKLRFHYTLAMTTYYAYMRRSEAFRMTLSMVDLDNKRFVLMSSQTKGARKYDVDTPINLPIPKKLIEILKIYIEEKFGTDKNPDYFLFSSVTKLDKAYYYGSYNRDFNNAVGDHLSFSKRNYGLKHTGVSNFWKENVEKGIPVGKILARLKTMCRHSSIVDTMNYLSTDLGIEIEEDNLFD
jgi:integrase